MAIVSYLVIGITSALSIWTIWSTLRPEMGRIIDLLVNGPVVAAARPMAIATRPCLRDVRVRAVTASPPRQRAAA